MMSASTIATVLGLLPDEQLFLAKAKIGKIVASLDRRLAVISELEAQARAANGGCLPQSLPEPLASKLALWKNLLERYESTAHLEKAVAVFVKAMESDAKVVAK